MKRKKHGAFFFFFEGGEVRTLISVYIGFFFHFFPTTIWYYKSFFLLTPLLPINLPVLFSAPPCSFPFPSFLCLFRGSGPVGGASRLVAVQKNKQKMQLSQSFPSPLFFCCISPLFLITGMSKALPRAEGRKRPLARR